MAQKTRIKILTSENTGTPLNSGNRILKTGELAYSYAAHGSVSGGDRLYIGTGTESGGVAAAQEVIGGVYFTEMLDHTKGTLTANSAVITNANNYIDALNVSALRVDTDGGTGNVFSGANTNTSLSGATNAQIPSAAAVKAYVDSTVEANNDIQIATDSGSLNIELDTHTLTFDGTDGITVSGDNSNKKVTIDLDPVLTAAGGSAGSYGSATAIPAITVNAQGQITAISTNAISSSFTLSADSGTNDTFNNGETLTFEGTANEISTTVSNNKITFALPDDVTIGDDLTVTGDASIGGNAVITGNLTVNGTTTSVNSSEITIDDPIQVLGDGTSSDDGKDRGIRFKYYDAASSSVKEGFFGFDGGASNSGTERFVFKNPLITSDGDDQDAPWGDAQFGGVYAGNLDLGITNDNTITTSSGNLTIAAAGASVIINDTVDLNGSLDVSGALTLGTALAVAEGGTGNTSFTDNGILYGDGTNALDVTAAGSQYDILQAGAGGVPVFSATIDGGTY